MDASDDINAFDYTYRTLFKNSWIVMSSGQISLRAPYGSSSQILHSAISLFPIYLLIRFFSIIFLGNFYMIESIASQCLFDRTLFVSHEYIQIFVIRTLRYVCVTKRYTQTDECGIVRYSFTHATQVATIVS